MVEWDKDREQAKVKSGYAALERESDAARERVWELMRRVATMVTQPPPASLLRSPWQPRSGQFETTEGIFAEQEQVSVDDILFTAARDYAAFAV